MVVHIRNHEMVHTYHVVRRQNVNYGVPLVEQELPTIPELNFYVSV